MSNSTKRISHSFDHEEVRLAATLLRQLYAHKDFSILVRNRAFPGLAKKIQSMEIKRLEAAS